MDDPSREHDRPPGPSTPPSPGGVGQPDPWSADVTPTDRWGPPPVPAVAVRRRWPWIVLVVLLLAGGGVATGVALDQRDTAEQWRDRALAVEGERDLAIERGDDLEGQLDQLVAVLATSEDDVAMLEARIRQLADEKAQAEDAATTVEVERDVVVELTADIAAATDALDACVDRLFDLQAASVAAFNQTVAGEEVDVEPLNAQARDTTAFCNDARTAAARASAAAQQLTGQ